MKKTNKELNTEHDRRQQERVRPAPRFYDFEPLQSVVNTWIKERVNREQT